jgi:hypothetical protein
MRLPPNVNHDVGQWHRLAHSVVELIVGDWMLNGARRLSAPLLRKISNVHRHTPACRQPVTPRQRQCP